MITREIREMFSEDSDHEFAARLMGIRCMAHRLKKFGFDEFINLYSAKELMLLAMFFNPDYPAAVDALMKEASLKPTEDFRVEEVTA